MVSVTLGLRPINCYLLTISIYGRILEIVNNYKEIMNIRVADYEDYLEVVAQIKKDEARYTSLEQSTYCPPFSYEDLWNDDLDEEEEKHVTSLLTEYGIE